jgi:hypothetical protein
VQIDFSDPMKVFLQEVYDFTDDQLWGSSSSRDAGDPRYKRQCMMCASTGLGDDASHCSHCSGVGHTLLSPREALQELGTEWGRAMYNETWTQLCLERAHGLIQTQRVLPRAHGQWSLAIVDTVVISGLRYPDEADAIHESGGVVIFVERDNTRKVRDHDSERWLDIVREKADAIVVNNGSLFELAKSARRAVAATSNPAI